MATTRQYKDINFNFKPHPFTGDIVKVVDELAVAQSIKTLVLTRFYERPFSPDRGTPIYGLLFELMTPFTASVIAEAVKTVINNSEPRADLLTVTVLEDQDNNSYNVEIVFMVKNTYIPVQLDIILKRI